MLVGENHIFLICPHIIKCYVVSSCDHEWSIRCIDFIYMYRKHQILLDGEGEGMKTTIVQHFLYKTQCLGDFLDWIMLLSHAPHFLMETSLYQLLTHVDPYSTWQKSKIFICFRCWLMFCRFKVTRLKCLSWCHIGLENNELWVAT